MTEVEANEKSDKESSAVLDVFMKALDVDEEVAVILIQEGFSSLEEVAYVPEQEMLDIEEFDADIVSELRNRARDVLLTKAIEKEEHKKDPAEDLLALEGMDDQLASQLAHRGIITQEDLAEQAVDDIEDIEGLDNKRASQLIMAARAPWFEDEQQA